MHSKNNIKKKNSFFFLPHFYKKNRGSSWRDDHSTNDHEQVKVVQGI